MKFTATQIIAEIRRTDQAISAALWEVPADMDLAQTLVSKLLGLRICLALNEVPTARMVSLQ